MCNLSLVIPHQIEAIDLLSASQLAQLTVNLGALDNTNMINMVFDTLGDSNAFQNVDDFLAGLAKTFQVCPILKLRKRRACHVRF